MMRGLLHDRQTPESAHLAAILNVQMHKTTATSPKPRQTNIRYAVAPLHLSNDGESGREDGHALCCVLYLSSCTSRWRNKGQFSATESRPTSVILNGISECESGQKHQMDASMRIEEGNEE